MLHLRSNSPLRSLGSRAAALCASALLFAGCSSVQVQTDGELSLEPGDTFAWVNSDGLRVNRQGLQQEVPWDELREALEDQMEARGLVRAPANVADVTAQMSLDFEIVTRENDPYFDFYVASRYERATLRLTLRDGDNDLWVAKDERRLRYTEQMQGSMASPNWITVDEDREWDVEDFAAGIGAVLPVKD